MDLGNSTGYPGTFAPGWFVKIGFMLFQFMFPQLELRVFAN